MKVLKDSVRYIRSKPYLFLSDGVFDPSSVCSRIAIQGFKFGATEVTLVNHDPWWAVISNFNWLLDKSKFPDPKMPFIKIISDTRLGQNSYCSEILLTAFCGSVMVYTEGTQFLHFGKYNLLPNELSAHTNNELALFFLYEPA